MNRWYTAPSVVQNICADMPLPGDASALAQHTGEAVRDNRGEVHCPCGSVTGLNLRNQMPQVRRCCDGRRSA